MATLSDTACLSKRRQAGVHLAAQHALQDILTNRGRTPRKNIQRHRGECAVGLRDYGEIEGSLALLTL